MARTWAYAPNLGHKAKLYTSENNKKMKLKVLET